jgi:biotin carboxylase
MHVVLLETTIPRGFHHVAMLAAHGAEVTFVTEDLDRYRAVPGFEDHRHCARTITVSSTLDAFDLGSQLLKRLGPNPVDAVMCVHDQYVPAANQLAVDLGVPHEEPSTIRLLRDKAAVRQRLDQAGLGSIRWRLVEDPADAVRAAAEVGYPLVAKPPRSYGSMGVAVAWDAAQLAAHLAGASGPVLLEQYVSGRHVSAEVLVQDGRPMVLGFADRLPAPPGVTAELGGHFPARFEGMGAARRMLLGLVHALGVRNSALHVELMITAAGPELIEANARVAGHVVSEQIGRALGRSVTLDLLALALGQPLEPLDEPVATLALRQFWTDRPGMLDAVHLPPLPGEVVRCEPVVRVGDRVRALQHNFDRLGYVLTQAPTEAQAVAVADDIARQVRFEITSDPGEPAAGDKQRPGPGEPAAGDEQRPGPGDEQRPGPHVLLVLDDDDPERILDAVGSATRHVSVLWSGGPPATARRYWAQRYIGRWLDSEAAAKELADPPRAVVGLTPGPAVLASALREVLAPETASRSASTPGSADALPGHVVVLLNGVLWAMLDDSDPTTVTTSAANEELARRAIEAVRDIAGVACCRVPDEGPVTVSAGIEGPYRALCDAVTGRDLASATVAAALGERIETPARRHGAAVLRRVPAPVGRFRVAEATVAEDLYADPAVTHVDVTLPPGRRHTSPGPADRLRFVVTGGDLGSATEAAERVESSLRFRAAPQDRTHVLVLDRIGRAAWTRDNGTPVLPPDRYRVTVISGRPPATVAADDFLHVDVFDEPLLTAFVTGLHESHPIDRIACAAEHLLAPAARLRARLGVPGDSLDRVRAVRDKAEMKRICRRAGIPHAAGRVVYEPSDALHLLEEHGALVVKPRDRSGAQGVRFLRDRSDLDDWLRTTMVPGVHLAEAHQPGPVCHIDAVVHRGVVAWDVSRYGMPALDFAAGRPVTSWSVADPRVRDLARDLLDRVLAAWQIERGVVHLEAFDAGDRLDFGELAGRAGGGGIPAAFRLARGIDLRHAKLAIDAGDDPRRLLGEPAGAYAGWIVHYSPGGRLTEFDDSAVRDLAAYRELNAEIGAEVPPAAFRGTGLATYAFAAVTEAGVRDLLRRATDDIRIRIQPALTEEGRP